MKISVALCTFNGEAYLAEQLDSILSQSVKVDEIIISDDGSVDSTISILQSYKEKHKNIFQIHQNNRNIGYIKNFESAIEQCTGDLIFLSDQDDIWHQDKVKKISKEFAKNNSINVIAHDLYILSKEKKILEKSFWEISGLNLQSSNKEIITSILLDGNIFPGMSLAISSNAKKYLPFFYSNKFLVHDLQLVIKSSNENSFKLYPVQLSTYRLHNAQNIGYEISDKTTDINEFFIRKKSRAEFINILAIFKLNPDLVKEYDQKTTRKIYEFLSMLNPVQRAIMYLKIKYYYQLYP